MKRFQNAEKCDGNKKIDRKGRSFKFSDITGAKRKYWITKEDRTKLRKWCFHP